MKFSTYIQHCLKELEEDGEYETDIYLVNLVRIQHLTERIYQLNAGPDTLDTPGLPRAPTSAYQSVFQGELDKIVNSLSPSMKTNSTYLNLLPTLLHPIRALEKSPTFKNSIHP